MQILGSQTEREWEVAGGRLLPAFKAPHLMIIFGDGVESRGILKQYVEALCVGETNFLL